MWASEPPKVTVQDSARACVEGIRDKSLQRRLLAACPELLDHSEKMQASAASSGLHTVRTDDYSVTDVEGKELRWLYKTQLSKVGRPARRKIYDQLKASAPHEMCVYCGHSVATTLDHFIPQARVPGLAIDPWNLVPACSECNHGLLDYFSDRPDEQLLHPYFAPEIGRWLTASVDHTDPVAMRFAAAPDRSLDPELQSRIRHQFDALNLGYRYRVLCGRDLSGLNRRLCRDFKGASPDEVSAYLTELASPGFLADENDRRSVMFEALAADRWYCAGGYAPPLEQAA